MAGLTAEPKRSKLTVMSGLQLNPEIETAILNNVRAGATIVEAARAAGVAGGTVRRWIKLGNKGQKPYREFVENLDRAEATPRVKALRCWDQAIEDGDWRAAEKKLRYQDERRDSPANIERHLEAIFEVLTEELGAEEARRVFGALIERDSGEAASGTRAALRLVAGE